MTGIEAGIMGIGVGVTGWRGWGRVAGGGGGGPGAGLAAVASQCLAPVGLRLAGAAERLWGGGKRGSGAESWRNYQNWLKIVKIGCPMAGIFCYDAL